CLSSEKRFELSEKPQAEQPLSPLATAGNVARCPQRMRTLRFSLKERNPTLSENCSPVDGAPPGP
ncbi:hypothetical protein, partial [Halomonas sp.]|uniref:hypothetical protein n=1 Tax=Halomonas sp. TaxID=1486246 RepID=UPI0025B90B32